MVHPGTALDAQGRQVVLSDTRTVSLADGKGQTVEVVIAYSQEEADPQMTEVWPEGPRVVEGTEPHTLVAVPLTLAGVVESMCCRTATWWSAAAMTG